MSKNPYCTYHNTSSLTFILSFRKDVLLDYILNWQHKLKVRIIKESDLDLFYEYVLKLGFFMHDYPNEKATGILSVYGGIVSTKYQEKYRPRSFALNLSSANYMTLTRRYAGTEKIVKPLYLDDTPLNRERLADDLLPLYINTPILKTYVKEKWEGYL